MERNDSFDKGLSLPRETMNIEEARQNLSIKTGCSGGSDRFGDE